MYQYRQILVRMRQGDSDRDSGWPTGWPRARAIARAKTMGRKKYHQLARPENRASLTSSQWIDLVGFLTIDGEFPVGHQLIAPKLDPGLYQAKLFAVGSRSKSLHH